MFLLTYRKLFLFFFSRINHTELLSSWESLLHWSDNESFVKQSQEEMAALVDKLNKIGTFEPNLDTESAIQCAIQETKVSFTIYRITSILGDFSIIFEEFVVFTSSSIFLRVSNSWDLLF